MFVKPDAHGARRVRALSIFQRNERGVELVYLEVVSIDNIKSTFRSASFGAFHNFRKLPFTLRGEIIFCAQSKNLRVSQNDARSHFCVRNLTQ